MQKLQRYVADGCWVLEAMVMLVVARSLVVCCFRRVAPWVLRLRDARQPEPPFALQRRVRFIIGVAVRKLPWNQLCLSQAIAGKMMLARRGFSSSIYLGAGFRNGGDLHAHAWLRAGDTVITGESGIDTIVPLSGKH